MEHKKVYIAMVNDGVISVHDTEEKAQKAADVEALRVAKNTGRLQKAQRRGYPESPTPADVGAFPRVVPSHYWQDV